MSPRIEHPSRFRRSADAVEGFVPGSIELSGYLDARDALSEVLSREPIRIEMGQHIDIVFGHPDGSELRVSGHVTCVDVNANAPGPITFGIEVTGMYGVGESVVHADARVAWPEPEFVYGGDPDSMPDAQTVSFSDEDQPERCWMCFGRESETGTGLCMQCLDDVRNRARDEHADRNDTAAIDS